MASGNVDVLINELMLLLENKGVEIEFSLQKFKRFQTHEILKGRPIYGEYHHLFPVLRKYPDKFYSYTRMEISTFDYILAKVSPLCQKKWCNFHQAPILAEERLVVTLRCAHKNFGMTMPIMKSKMTYICQPMYKYINTLKNLSIFLNCEKKLAIQYIFLYTFQFFE